MAVLSNPSGSEPDKNMDRSFKTLIVAFLISFSSLFAQSESPEKIRLYLWAAQDAYPEFTEDKPHDLARQHLTNLSEYLIEGMTYGFSFDYTPSDKLRKVDEYFELVPLNDFSEDKDNIKWDKTYWREDKIFLWVNFTRTEQMMRYYKQFSQIKNPHAVGKGKGKLSKGFEGLQQAIENAAKDGIREYYRKIIKNKPRQITGKLLIRSVPAILIDKGYYVVQLDFFLETSKIKEYSQF